MLEIRDEAKPNVIVWINERDPQNKPYSVDFTLGQGFMIKGIEQAILELCKGQKAQFIVPRELAYVDADLREVPDGLRRNSNLLCKLEIIDFDCRSKPILSLQVSPGNQFICCSS